MKFFCSFLLSVLLALPAFGQNGSGFGVFGDLNYNIHSADFRALPGVPNCCERFGGGAGTGMNLGVLYQQLLPWDSFLVQLRAGYNSFDATLSRVESTVLTGNVPGRFEHRLESRFSALSLSPLLSYVLPSGITLHGGLFGAFLQNASFHQRETIIEPDYGTFADTQLRYRNDSSGAIPNANSLYSALSAGVSYALPLNRARTLVLSPEVFFSWGLTNFVNDLSWQGHSVRAGIAILYMPASAASESAIAADIPPPAETAPPVAELPPAEKPVPEKPAPVLAAAISAAGVDEDGRELPDLTLRIEEFHSTQARPLLPYIFFDEHSAVLPERYSRLTEAERRAFTPEKLHHAGTLATYYHVLNIVGYRLQQFPGSTIMIKGHNDDAGEKGNTDLSRRRARTLQDYLVEVWKIDPERIRIESLGLPEKFSNITEPDGIRENRRAEITTDDWRILEPLVTTDTLRTSNPPVLRMRPEITAGAGLRSWRVRIAQEGRTVHELTGQGEAPEHLEWALAEDQVNFPRGSAPLEVTLQVSDESGRSITAEKREVPVNHVSLMKKQRERIADKEIDRFSLILFDFDKSTLSEANERIAARIRASVRPNSTVRISGYTDRLGDAAYNQRLSLARAQATAGVLKAENAIVQGVGESTLLYDNELPEGRFYSRTVMITIETPVE